MAPGRVIHTVGHSTRSLEELVAVLGGGGVQRLVDVRVAPGSRRHPHFARQALEQSLPAEGIAYRHEPALGGFRTPRAESPNLGWEQPAFRGYADHMGSAEFRTAISRLKDEALEQPTCIMCAEAQWWRCHRRLIADALVAQRWRVLHLGLGGAPIDHRLTPFALAAADGTLTYPPLQQELG